MGKTRGTVKKKGRDSSSPKPVRRNTRSTNPHPLIPLVEKKKDKDTKKGPGLNARRRGRHEDVLRRLQRMIIKDKDQTQWPGGGGLFRIPYKHTYPRIYGPITRKMDLRDFVRKEKKDVTTGLWEGVDVKTQELGKFLDQMLRERPYVTFREEMGAVLGNLYISREIQGDFIYLNIREQSMIFGDSALLAAATIGEQEENYFFLESKNGDTWISIDGVEGVLPSTLVSVNGEALGSSGAGTSLSLGGKRKLEFGDIITVSANKGDKMQEWERTDLLFKPSTLRYKSGKGKNGKVINPKVGGSSSPLDNPLILATVLCFLRTNEVKEARLVSHFWNEEALQALRKRTQEVAIRVFDQVEIGSGDGVGSMTVFNPLSEPLLQFPNWKVALPGNIRKVGGVHSDQLNLGLFRLRKKQRNFVEGLETHRIRTTDQKTLDDLKGLFGSQRHVKSLRLTVGTERETHLKMLEVMLSGVKDTLTTLTLTLSRRFEKESMTFSPFSVEELPCLSHLSLRLGNRGFSPQPSAQIKRFLASLLPAMGNIQSLTILDRSSSEPLKEIAKMQNQDPSKFDRLSQIKIQGCSNNVLRALSSLRKDSLKTLKVEVGAIHRLDVDTASLRHALERFSESLQELKLELRPGDRTTSLPIHFPARMGNLTALSVFVRSHWIHRNQPRTRVHFGPPEGEQPGPNEGDNRMNDIDYARHFPSLSKLTVAPAPEETGYRSGRTFQICERTGWRTFLPFLSAFLPTQRPVPSITTLDIPFLLKGKYHPVLDNLEAIFPAVGFPPERLARARGGPIWADDEEEQD